MGCILSCAEEGAKGGGVVPSRSKPDLTTRRLKFAAMFLLCSGNTLLVMAYFASLGGGVAASRKKGCLSPYAWFVAYPTLAGCDLCLLPGTFIDVVCLARVYQAQQLNAWHAVGRFGDAPKLKLLMPRLAISWAAWLDAFATLSLGLALSCYAVVGLMERKTFIDTSEELLRWAVWFPTLVGSTTGLLVTVLLVASAREPLYSCIPPLFFRARSKLPTLSVGCAFWGALCMAIGSLGLFDLTFEALLPSRANFPFSNTFGVANIFLALSNSFAISSLVRQQCVENKPAVSSAAHSDV